MTISPSDVERMIVVDDTFQTFADISPKVITLSDACVSCTYDDFPPSVEYIPAGGVGQVGDRRG